MRRTLLLVLLVVDVACSDGSSPAPAAAEPLPPELAMLGSAAQPTALVAAGQLGPTGGAVALADGVVLVGSPGSVAAPIDVRLQRVELDVFEMAVESTSAYVIRAPHVPGFTAPVYLQVPGWTPGSVASVFEGGQWQRIALAPGPVARIDLAHFSDRTVTVRRGWVEQITPVTQETIQGRVESGVINQGGNANAAVFFGLGETQPRSGDELCAELMQVLSAPGRDYGYPPGWSWRDVSPAETFRRNTSLAGYLHSNAVPEQLGGPYWDLTANHMDDIHQRLVSTTAPVTPAGMFRICLDSYGGNVPMAVLACHNYLKNVTELGRYARVAEVPDHVGQAASHLQTWRRVDRTPAGFYDKMGPLYHVFATMTAGVWSLASLGGYGAAYIEAFLRATGLQGDPEDTDKTSADRCGARLGSSIRLSAAGQAATGPVIAGQGQTLAVPRSADAGAAIVDGGAGDGATADVDGGMPNPFDGGPSPATSPQGWPGHWRGHGKFTASIPGVGLIDRDTPVEVTTTVTSPGSVRLVYGLGASTETIDITLSAVNPNAGRGTKDVVSPPPAPGVTLRMTYTAVAFLREGRLYLAVRQQSHSSATVSTGTGFSASGEADVPSDLIAILDRVP